MEPLQKVYQVAAELTGDDQPSVREIPALAAPARSTGKAARKQAMTSGAVKVNVKQKAFKPAKATKAVSPAEATPKSSARTKALSPLELAPTDVRVKPSKKAAAPKAAKVPKAPRTKVSKAADRRQLRHA